MRGHPDHLLSRLTVPVVGRDRGQLHVVAGQHDLPVPGDQGGEGQELGEDHHGRLVHHQAVGAIALPGPAVSIEVAAQLEEVVDGPAHHHVAVLQAFLDPRYVVACDLIVAGRLPTDVQHPHRIVGDARRVGDLAELRDRLAKPAEQLVHRGVSRCRQQEQLVPRPGGKTEHDGRRCGVGLPCAGRSQHQLDGRAETF